MSADIRRNHGGQFAKGQSGNAEGARRRRGRMLMSPDDIHRTILDVAETTVQTSLGGKTETMSLFKRNVMMLALGQANRAASHSFIELTKSAAFFVERQAKREAEEERRRERQERQP